MATTIRISAKLEKALRSGTRDDAEGLVLEVVDLIDAAQAKAATKQPTTGLDVKTLIVTLNPYRPVILPQHGDKESVYARLQKALTKYRVTPEQAHALGAWLKAQSWMHDLTVDMLTRNLGGWLDRALASRPAFKRSVWAEGGEP